MEYFDVYNEEGFPTGERVTRKEAHEKGILHAAVHIYVYRIKNGHYEILLQKRSDDKDSFPSCWDTSCAGHVSAGDSFEDTVIKELSEELGIKVNYSDVVHCFTKIVTKINSFHGKIFNDHEVYKVYKLKFDAPAESLKFQKEEISDLKWMDAEALLLALEANDPEYCIMPDTYKKALLHIKSE